MTIRLSDIRFDNDGSGYLPKYPRNASVTDEDILSVIRHIMRDRSDCSIIPIVKDAFATDTINDYGHNLFVEVAYSGTNDWRATYGATIGSTVSNVVCYMD